MYIIDDVAKTSLSQILLLLEVSDVKQLIFDLGQLLENKDDINYHFHLNDALYQKEITVCLINGNDTSYFHPDIIEIIAKEL